MAKNLLTSSLKNRTAEMFVQDISVSPYYLAVSKNTSFTPDDQTLPIPSETQQTFTANIYNDMIFGRKLAPTDVSLMIPRHDWKADTVFDMYTGNDDALLTKSFYAAVNVGITYDVYKCLDNNNGANSTVEPSGQDINPFMTPSDGYMWKYMYSVPSGTWQKFTTEEFMPMTPNTAVISNASAGTIDVIKVTVPGSGYNSFVVDTFRAQDIGINGDTTKFGLPDTSSNLSGFYQNCVIKMTSGVANNEYRTIIDYRLTGGQKVITIDSGFTQMPAATDTYEIYPAVTVVGDGREIINCAARAIVSATSNSISAIEVLNSGQGYRAATASIVLHPSVGVSTNATLLPIISPPGGHGSNPADELGASYAAICTSFSGSESNNIPTANDYRQLEVIRNPLFSNVEVAIDFSTIVGTFADTETVYSYKSIPLSGTVSVANASAVVVGTNTSFTSTLTPGDNVIVTGGSSQLLSTVSVVVNDTQVNLVDAVPFTNTACLISSAKLLGSASLTSSNTAVVVLTDCSASFANATGIIGGSTFASVAVANTSPAFTINNADVANFKYFVQMSQITGTLTSGIFQDDETIYQATSNYTATLFAHVSGSPDYLYVNNENGVYDHTSQLIGLSSGAIFTPTNKYAGPLKVDSGEILYFENISPITRDSSKSETIKVILEF